MEKWYKNGRAVVAGSLLAMAVVLSGTPVVEASGSTISIGMKQSNKANEQLEIDEVLAQLRYSTRKVERANIRINKGIRNKIREIERREEERKQREEEERKKLEEQKRKEEQKQKEEEQKKIKEQKRKEEEQRQKEEEERIARERAPKPFIIDSDFSSDIDDALAISTASYYIDSGLIDVRGVALCCSSIRGAYAMNALLQAHGKSYIPVASAAGEGIAIGSAYHLAMEQYPHSENITVGAVKFYRKLLAESETKINIVTLGQLTNLNNLLNSQPDAYSPLTGAELIAEKVECVYAVAGKHDGRLENNIFYGGEDYGGNPYYNNTKVAEAARNVASNWPSKIIWMEADLVGGFNVGDFYCSSDRGQSFILTKALDVYGTPGGSASFDPFGIMIAALKSNNRDEELGIEFISGTMRINLGGTSYFTDSDITRDHYRLIKLRSNNSYREMIQNGLKWEFTSRTGKEVR